MAVRLPDFASAYFDGISEVTGVVPEGVDIRRLLQRPGEVTYVDTRPAGQLARSNGTLGVVAVERDVDAAALASVLQGIGYGNVVILLLGWPALDLPWHRVLDSAVAADLQVVEVVTVTARRFPTVAVLRRERSLVAPPPYLSGGAPPAVLPEGRSGDGARPKTTGGSGSGRRLALRMAGELAFVGLRERRLRIVADEAVKASEDRLAALAAATKQIEQAEAELDKERDRLSAVEAKLGDLRRSASVRLGKAVKEVRGVRGVVKLPREALTIWRERKQERSRD